MMNIELTFQQAQKAIALIDAAVKAIGLNAASDGLEIARIIQTAIEQENSPKEEK